MNRKTFENLQADDPLVSSAVMGTMRLGKVLEPAGIPIEQFDECEAETKQSYLVIGRISEAEARSRSSLKQS
jgi:hypothetical protein